MSEQRHRLAEVGLASNKQVLSQYLCGSPDADRWLLRVFYWAGPMSELAFLVPTKEPPAPPAPSAAVGVWGSPSRSTYVAPSASTLFALDGKNSMQTSEGLESRLERDRDRDRELGSAAAAASPTQKVSFRMDALLEGESEGERETQLQTRREEDAAEAGPSVQSVAGSRLRQPLHSQQTERTERSGAPQSSAQAAKHVRAQQQMLGDAGRVLIVWLERVEDRENVPVQELFQYVLSRTTIGDTGNALHTGSTGNTGKAGDSSRSTGTGIGLSGVNVSAGTELQVVYLHLMRQTGLIRVMLPTTSAAETQRVQAGAAEPVGAVGPVCLLGGASVSSRGGGGSAVVAGPLVDGMAVSRAALGPLLRHTILNIQRRRRLELFETCAAPHVRRKKLVDEIIKQHVPRVLEHDFCGRLLLDAF